MLKRRHADGEIQFPDNLFLIPGEKLTLKTPHGYSCSLPSVNLFTPSTLVLSRPSSPSRCQVCITMSAWPLRPSFSSLYRAHHPSCVYKTDVQTRCSFAEEEGRHTGLLYLCLCFYFRAVQLQFESNRPKAAIVNSKTLYF